MKKVQFFLAFCFMGVAGLFLMSADHTDAPAVTSKTSDISDFYAFAEGDNIVFVATLQGPMSPTASSSAAFDENVMIEFNIDNTGDNVEDLVIQAVPGT